MLCVADATEWLNIYNDAVRKDLMENKGKICVIPSCNHSYSFRRKLSDGTL